MHTLREWLPSRRHRRPLAAFAIATLALALPAADYAVSASGGNDANPGTLAQPWRTLTKAFSVAGSGDRIFVFPGRYSPTHGETFPLVVQDGVKVLGTNARECIIDAEFDPTVANPKDKTVNPVQGTVIRIGAKCELARMSIVNGPRNPGNPGDYWWAITVHVGGGNDPHDAWVHHCVLDEFSRGIFVGDPSKSQGFSNVNIDNCVLSRFYVEAVNATANNGTTSGNRLFHCTIVGHKNPGNQKNFGRACISFGTGAAFDVRNCVIKDGDWAGLEVGASTNVTSDFNCYHGSSAAVRGVNKGSNDIETDPGLAFLPTATATVDPHHAGPGGALWEKGTNIVTTGSDLDHGSQRLSGAFVDIGADEFTGTDTWFVGFASIGATVHIGALGSRSNALLFALGLANTAPISIPGIQGKLEVDLSKAHVLLPFSTDARGFVRQAAPIPKDSTLIGIAAYIQCLDVASATLSDLDVVHFTR